MYLSVVSVFILAAAGLVFRWAGRHRLVRLVLVGTVAVSGVALVLWGGLNRITGAGITDAVFYHLATGLEGGDISQYTNLMFASVAGLMALFYGCFRLYRGLGGPRAGRPFGDVGVLVLLGLAIALNPFFVDVTRHFSQIYLAGERNGGFVDAKLTQVPERRKNLVLIYLESFERTYFDQKAFPGLITDLRPIEAKAQSFTSVGQSIGAGFTIGGMVAGQCGVPLLLLGSENSMQVSNFLTGATCLGDLLEEAGYRTEYLGGSALEFAGKGAFYESHGFDQVSGLETLKASLADPSYLGPWGLQDDTLFGLAKDKLSALSVGPDPFALVMLTLDTHHPDGHASTNRACKEVVYGDGSNAMLTSVKCADRLAADFIRSIQNSPMAKDTVIVVASDHVAMVNGAVDQLQALPRSNLFFILQPDAEPATIDRNASTLDIGATILAALGMDVGQIGFGVNLLGHGPTLAESQPKEGRSTERFSDYLMGFQAVYARLWDYPKIDEGFYVDLEAKILEIGSSAFKFPALVLVDTEGRVQHVIIADPAAEKSLAAHVLSLPDDQPFLWLDACDILAPLARAAAEGALCVLSGELSAENMTVAALPVSGFVPRERVLTTATVGLPAVLANRQDALRDLLVDQGFAPQDLALGRAAYRGRDLIIRSVAAGHGASLVRLLTTDSLDSGMDVVLGRGINLVAIDAEGAPKLLANVDSCQPKNAPPPLKAVIEAATDALAFAIVAHDSAVCDAGPGALRAALAGLDLPVAQSIGFRQPYVALITQGGTPREFVDDGQSRLYLRLRPDGEGSAPAKPARAKLRTAPTSVCVDPPAHLYPATSAPMSLGVAYSLATAPAELAGVGQGWWDIEPFGRWIGADRADLRLRLPPDDDLRLTIIGLPYRKAGLPFEVWAGDRKLGVAVLTEGKPAEIPLSGLAGGSEVELVLVFADSPLLCPALLNLSPDARRLIAMVQSIEVRGTPAK